MTTGSYRLTREAQADLIKIRSFTLEHWGEEQFLVKWGRYPFISIFRKLM